MTSAGAPAVPLGWGRRFLVCRPTHFELAYAINPWMDPDDGPVDRDRAVAQWEDLVAALRAAGAAVEEVEPVDGLPDMVFTANGGVVSGGRFVPATFRHAERAAETRRFSTWAAAAGFEVADLAHGTVHEGAGDALPVPVAAGADPVLLCGHGPRSDVDAAPQLADRLGCRVVPVGLVDERLYHLDITYCPVAEGVALCTPAAWTAAGARAVAGLVADPITLELDEALRFTANSVAVGPVVLMPHVPPRVGRELERRGLEPVLVDVSQLQRAGGACRCLTLALDVDLSPLNDAAAG